ncbi:putative intracellular protease/amidase [Inhella inkyongensis]|uniref:Putative intracellular protease/amidase n=1 Tax=Inhella inkyongensis TaxID=392593 RepID=A0A840S3L9_9BURK|nr:type 1 glutamine amidotransferase domain-containing protein [Inhella inkyongensis]MBB5204038.1 putative intracellular protease/amidase [Inhella inkyongensis]
MARLLIPLPRQDHDPSEVAIPWQLLREQGHICVFATPDGRPAQADLRMLSGQGLGPFKGLLAADARARATHEALRADPAFQRPLAWSALQDQDFDALWLAGGHAQGMREYLESPMLQALVARHAQAGRPLAAVCHGVVLAARSRDAQGRSVLAGRRVTALLARQELAAWWLTRAWLGDYYRTYPQTVQAEVTAALGEPTLFEPGPLPIARDAPGQEGRGFAQQDGNWVTGRWPGDLHRMVQLFSPLLRPSNAASTAS